MNQICRPAESHFTTLFLFFLVFGFLLSLAADASKIQSLECLEVKEPIPHELVRWSPEDGGVLELDHQKRKKGFRLGLGQGFTERPSKDCPTPSTLFEEITVKGKVVRLRVEQPELIQSSVQVNRVVYFNPQQVAVAVDRLLESQRCGQADEALKLAREHSIPVAKLPELKALVERCRGQLQLNAEREALLRPGSNYDEITPLCDPYLEKRPRDVKVLKACGIASYQTENYGSARRYFEAFEDVGEDATVSIHRGLIELEQEHFKKAIELLESASRDHGDAHPEAFYYLGLALYMNEDFTPAGRHLSMFLEADSNLPRMEAEARALLSIISATLQAGHQSST